MAWTDDEGLKVAGVPNLAAGTDTCTLTAPAHVISATGRMPSFGGADVNAVAGVGGAAGGAGAGGGGAKPAGTPKAIRVRLSGKATRAAFAKGLTVKVGALKAGRIDASAAIAKKVARKLRLSGGASAARIATRGFAAASTVTVARGHARAKRAGTVKEPPQADQGRQARRQADAQGRADDQGQPARRRRQGDGPPQVAAPGALAASSLASTPRSAATSSSERRPPKRSSNAAAKTAPMWAYAAAPSLVSSARTMLRSCGAICRATQRRLSKRSISRVAPLRLTSRASASLNIVHPPPGRDHQPADRLRSSSVVPAASSSRRFSAPRSSESARRSLDHAARRSNSAVWGAAPTRSTMGIVDGGKIAAGSGGGRELERAQALSDLRAAAVQPAHHGAGRHAEGLAASA